MTSRREVAHVTRGEFYGGIAAVWLFIVILIGRLPDGSANWLLEAAAAFAFVGCIVQIVRARLLHEHDTHEAA